MTRDALTFVVPVALKEVMDSLVPSFMQTRDVAVKMVHVLNPEVPGLIAQGQHWDTAVSNPQYVDQIVAAGHTTPASQQSFARAPLVFAARGQGTSHTAPDQIRDTLLAASSIAITDTGTSGEMFAVMAEKLGLLDDLTPKVQRLAGGEPMRSLLFGTTDLAGIPLTNIAPVAGVFTTAICPPEHGVHIDFDIGLRPSAPQAAPALAQWLCSLEIEDDLRRLGAERAG